MEITDEEYDEANRRFAELKAAFPAALSVRYDRRSARVVIAMSSGVQISFLPRDVEGLENASAEELAVAEISSSGLGIHFPRIDADIYVPGLINGQLGSKRWMKSRATRSAESSSQSERANLSIKHGKPSLRQKKQSDD